MAHCGNYQPKSINRRDMLTRCGSGFGMTALAALMGEKAFGGVKSKPAPNLFGPRKPHYAPKAKNVIFLYMDGGPSQVDTFDPKPRLTKENGKPYGLKIEATQFNNIGNILGSPWKFNQYGQSGIPVSDLFPNVARHVDKLAVVRSMTSKFPEHTNANYLLHTGHGLQGRPGMGAWVSYGLGSECQDLPGYIILNGGLIPPGGLDNFNSGFLPASYQGSVFKATNPPVSNINRLERIGKLQKNKLSLMSQLDAQAKDQSGTADSIESAIANYEMAFRMQAAVPQVMDLSKESEKTKDMYGMNSKYKPTQIYANQCIVARRMIERGVRFIQLTCSNVGGDRWDQHSGLKKGHENNARAVDQPIAALLTDLHERGLLEETLVVWTGEFGRTPFAQGTNGRDHNPHGFSMWMAGAGIKGGTIYGATDEYGYKAVEDRLEIHDLHATMLHLLGINHERLTYRFSGRDMRLTDVHGHVVKEILT